jgi:hypothetical protein
VQADSRGMRSSWIGEATALPPRRSAMKVGSPASVAFHCPQLSGALSIVFVSIGVPSEA